MRARRRPGPRRPIVTGLAVIVACSLLAACAEVESNLVETQPYKTEPIPGTDIKRILMEDPTAAKIGLQTATVRRAGKRTVVPHAALIYNPEGEEFVYTKPAARTYVRAPVKVLRIEGDRVLLSDGPPSGTVVVTLGAAELLATEYEILNQHP